MDVLDNGVGVMVMLEVNWNMYDVLLVMTTSESSSTAHDSRSCDEDGTDLQKDRKLDQEIAFNLI